jgi:hypothetical protein
VREWEHVPSSQGVPDWVLNNSGTQIAHRRGFYLLNRFAQFHTIDQSLLKKLNFGKERSPSRLF